MYKSVRKNRKILIFGLFCQKIIQSFSIFKNFNFKKCKNFNFKINFLKNFNFKIPFQKIRFSKISSLQNFFYNAKFLGHILGHLG